MKKFNILLCIGLIAALSSQAQGFVFQFQGEDLTDGETVVIMAEEDLFGDMSCESSSLAMTLLRGTSASVTATLEITFNSLNATTLQWCMGGNCQTLETSLTKRFTMGFSEQVQFDAIGIQSEGYLKATLRVTVGIESRQVNIMFVNGDVDGIKPLSQRNGGARAVYDLYGRRVQSPLPAGMYIVAEEERIRKVRVK
ncbi:MAG: hypothetical protein IKU02_01410 [Bacteroidaceae bacterium]|nr:hypothetical protein [Bacteroidaceae bacterium]